MNRDDLVVTSGAYPRACLGIQEGAREAAVRRRAGLPKAKCCTVRKRGGGQSRRIKTAALGAAHASHLDVRLTVMQHVHTSGATRLRSRRDRLRLVAVLVGQLLLRHAPAFGGINVGLIAKP